VVCRNLGRGGKGGFVVRSESDGPTEAASAAATLASSSFGLFGGIAFENDVFFGEGPDFAGELHFVTGDGPL